MCRLRNIALGGVTDGRTDGRTDRRTDRRRTKWSLCVAMLRRRQKNIVAAFRRMHVSPAKHSSGGVTDGRTDGRTDGQTDDGQSDPYVSLCFAGDTKRCWNPKQLPANWAFTLLSLWKIKCPNYSCTFCFLHYTMKCLNSVKTTLKWHLITGTCYTFAKPYKPFYFKDCIAPNVFDLQYDFDFKSDKIVCVSLYISNYTNFVNFVRLWCNKRQGFFKTVLMPNLGSSPNGNRPVFSQNLDKISQSEAP